MDHTSSVFSATSDCWSYLLNKSGDELRHSLVCTSLELEYTRITAKEEMDRNEHQLKQLLQLLNQTCKERDEANQRYQKLMIMQQAHKIHHHQSAATTTPATLTPPAPAALIPPILMDCDPADNLISKRLISVESTTSLDSDSITGRVSSPAPVNSINIFDHYDIATTTAAENHNLTGAADQNVSNPQLVEMKGFDLWPAVETKLPEKGKLLQAVMNAGPLLQTLLLAGPLPQWRHPPPPLDSFQIPPVGVVGSSCGTRVPTKKRPPESMESSTKYAG